MIKAYDIDLTIEQWEFLEHLIPAAKTGGRPRTTEMMSISDQRGTKILLWKAQRRGKSTSRYARIWVDYAGAVGANL